MIYVPKLISTEYSGVTRTITIDFTCIFGDLNIKICSFDTVTVAVYTY